MLTGTWLSSILVTSFSSIRTLDLFASNCKLTLSSPIINVASVRSSDEVEPKSTALFVVSYSEFNQIVGTDLIAIAIDSNGYFVFYTFPNSNY